MSYYQRLRDLREDADKKQSEVAAALFMQLTQYGRYERGERELPLNIAVAIAEYYNVSLDYVAGLSNSAQSIATVSHDGLSATERRLIEMFRSLGNFEQGQVFERTKALAEKSTK